MSTQQARRPYYHAVFTIKQSTRSYGLVYEKRSKSPSLVQTFLSFSAQGTPVYVRSFKKSEGEAEATIYESKSDKPFLYAVHPTQPTGGRSYLTQLPNELIQQCLRYLIDEDAEAEAGRDPACIPQYPPDECCTRHCTAWAIMLTCRRLSQLFKASLYANVNITTPTNLSRIEERIRHKERRQRRADRFCRSMKESPELRQLCKRLAVNVDIFSYLTQLCVGTIFFYKIRTFSLYEYDRTWETETFWDGHGASYTPGWNHCETGILRLLNLQKLYLGGDKHMLEYLTRIIGDLKSLKTLTLGGITCPGREERYPIDDIPEKRAARDKAALPPPVSLETFLFPKGKGFHITSQR
jgi:hypothetical protein